MPHGCGCGTNMRKSYYTSPYSRSSSMIKLIICLLIIGIIVYYLCNNK